MAAFLHWLADYIETRTARTDLCRTYAALVRCGVIKNAKVIEYPFTMKDARAYMEIDQSAAPFILERFGY